ncbi:MAG: hypothetical protein OEV44_12110 [Spirochaetota bacterium]|nr:hypothetical protein [Spirochaetota bacterium]
MGLFDITYQNAMRDYPLMLATNHTRQLPIELIAGKSETNQTMVELISYIGPNPVFVNKLV